MLDGIFEFIWILCIDEAHTVHQDGLFRPEFKSALDAIRQIHRLLSVKCSIIAMSATFQKVDQDVITHFLGHPPSLVMWLELSCHPIRFDAVCCGNPTASITSAMKQDASMSSSNKTIAYTNELITRIQTNNIVRGYTPIYWLQDGWPVDILLRNDVLIDENRASRWPRVIH